MWPYNHQIEPPGPFLEIIIRHPRLPAKFQVVSAKLDTGADISAIPQRMVDELALLPVRTLLVEGYDGGQTAIDTYAVTIEAAKARFRQTEAILVPEEHALLGRDLLNFFYIQLNGPTLTFDLRLAP